MARAPAALAGGPSDFAGGMKTRRAHRTSCGPFLSRADLLSSLAGLWPFINIYESVGARCWR